MSREQIVRDTAYAIWEAEGKPEGRDAQHWRLAEERVAASTGQPAKPVKGKVSSTANDKPKVSEPVKKAAIKPAPANKTATKAAASKSAAKAKS
ncbi:DUF2934 domain-containing protein [Bosea sp. ASV33]|uniref:DUF2934 domain-containing protein n=1 Tax=Bosea sp. ASV33 TaxID=2795106 RepID=UPI0018EBF1FF|nr:DUF2934 domain-containing protein [Bosea sp. ASV33]